MLQQILQSGAVWGALIGSGMTATIGVIAYIWKLHTTAVTNKVTIEHAMKTARERDKHLETKIDHVDEKVDGVGTAVNKVADKMDDLVEAHHETHEILVTHMAHEEVQQKEIEDLAEKLERKQDKPAARAVRN